MNQKIKTKIKTNETRTNETALIRIRRSAGFDEGVSRCGVGNWSRIKKLGFPELEHRTNIDLKDKWRTLTRAPPRDMLDRVQELNMKFKK